MKVTVCPVCGITPDTDERIVKCPKCGRTSTGENLAETLTRWNSQEYSKESEPKEEVAEVRKEVTRRPRRRKD